MKRFRVVNVSLNRRNLSNSICWLFQITLGLLNGPFWSLYPGADPGILVRGGVDFFFKGMELGAVLRPPMGPGQRHGGGPRGRSPRKLLNFSDFRSKI